MLVRLAIARFRMSSIPLEELIAPSLAACFTSTAGQREPPILRPLHPAPTPRTHTHKCSRRHLPTHTCLAHHAHPRSPSEVDSLTISFLWRAAPRGSDQAWNKCEWRPRALSAWLSWCWARGALARKPPIRACTVLERTVMTGWRAGAVERAARAGRTLPGERIGRHARTWTRRRRAQTCSSPRTPCRTLKPSSAR